MRVLLVTSSARGHALADALNRSPQKPDIISVCANNNPGIRALASEMHVQDIMDFGKIVEIAKKAAPDFAVIGPDDPIGSGLADVLEELGLPSVAPKKELARIESSKGFARNLLSKYGIDALPRFRVFESRKNSFRALAEEQKMYTFIDQDLRGEYVVKYDALKGGKGVKVSGEHLKNIDDGVRYAIDCMKDCGRVVIEEKLAGVEFSLLSFVSGKRVIDMPAVQDHKRAYDGDTGPNTGGMGTYTDADHSLPFLSPLDLARASEINKLTAEALMNECKEPYKGILYGGFMAVNDGVKVIEYNARFGDPEALNILPLLASDFVSICQAIIAGNLSDDIVMFEKKATVCKYIVPKSYPEKKDEKGMEVIFPEKLPENTRIFYGDVGEDEDGQLHLGGSRTAGIVGIGKTIAEAEKLAQNLCSKVRGPVRFRSDIGTDELIGKRAAVMKELRSK
ncbi:phosphoribosylamine--glycine ligase [Candidatus Peregrinibacteria bacterium]|nr:phosphoribosylamine--glycine ligase [Candidatus Peregrinibacteria bacterium]